MFYCEKEPYWLNSNTYFRDHINHFETPYWTWMVQNYKTLLMNKQGSWSDSPEQHWAFNTEADRTFFILRWS